VPHLELNLASTAEDMPEMAVALIRAIIAAADKDMGLSLTASKVAVPQPLSPLLTPAVATLAESKSSLILIPYVSLALPPAP
jgi:hypothetical protein